MHATWFRLLDRCAACDLDSRREPGFYLGSIYVNYAVTVAILTLIAAPAVVYELAPLWQISIFSVPFCVLFPLFFLPYARSLWLGLSEFWESPRAQAGDGPKYFADAKAQKPVAYQPPPPGAFEFLCPLCHARSQWRDENRSQSARCPSCRHTVVLLPFTSNRAPAAG